MDELEFRENRIDVDTYLKAACLGELEKADQRPGAGSP